MDNVKVAQKHDYYAVSFDRHSRVGWTDGRIYDSDPGYDDCHIIEVLSETTPKEMLAYYRKSVCHISLQEKMTLISILP